MSRDFEVDPVAAEAVESPMRVALNGSKQSVSAVHEIYSPVVKRARARARFQQIKALVGVSALISSGTRDGESILTARELIIPTRASGIDACARACAYVCNRILTELHRSEISRGIRRVATAPSRCYDKPSLMKQPRQCASLESLSLSLSPSCRRWRNVSPQRIITQWPRRGAFTSHNRVSAIGAMTIVPRCCLG